MPGTVLQTTRTRRGARRELTLIVSFAVLVLILVGAGAGVASRSVARQEALADAERSTRRLADLVVAPVLPAFLDGAPRGREDLDATVNSRLGEASLTDVVVWGADGTVLYSNRAADIGDRVTPVPPEVLGALAGDVSSDVQEGRPEADTPDGPGRTSPPRRLVEVYVPLVLRDQPPMVFEAYYDYGRVERLAQQLMTQLLPLVIAPLLLLQLIQIPAAVSLARRLRRHEKERVGLLERGLAGADQERARFAADLHDGPIQDLAGISYALGAVAPTVPERQAPLMARVQEALQRSIESLRGLMSDLYPPDLQTRSLPDILTDLAEPLRADGVEVEIEADDLPTVSSESVAALYRVAKESVRNVQKHAQATHVLLAVTLVPRAGERGTDLVRLRIRDDGVGVDPSRVDRRAEGHLGLRLLRDRVESLGGRLDIVSGPSEGTLVEAEVPVRALAPAPPA